MYRLIDKRTGVLVALAESRAELETAARTQYGAFWEDRYAVFDPVPPRGSALDVGPL